MDIEMDLEWKGRSKGRSTVTEKMAWNNSERPEIKVKDGEKKTLGTQIVKKRRLSTGEDLDCTALVENLRTPPSRLWRFLTLLPYVAISYLHLFLNVVVIFLLIYGSVSMALFLRSDIHSRISDRKTLLKNLIESSKMNYVLNKCDPSTRVPAMSKKCAEWEVIMNKKHSSIELTRIVVEVFGEACDSFVNRISLKSCVVCGIFFTLFLLFRNSRIGNR